MHYYFVGAPGTGSFTALSAMQQLGFTTRLRPTSISQCAELDAVGDLPVAGWFRGGLLPLADAELVLTVRGDTDTWLRECERRCAGEPLDALDPQVAEARVALFGQLAFSAEAWRAGYERHLARCGELARLAGKALHVWDVAADPSWRFLCALTGRPAPDLPFPGPKSRPLPAPALPATGDADPQGRLRRAPIQVRPSPLHGRGVFAAKPIRAGALLEECPVLVIDAYCEELGDYVIGWGDGDDGRLALPLGYGACYNHSAEPNAYWEADEARALMIIWAARDIAADEEIAISYGGEWFSTRGLRPAQERDAPPVDDPPR
jgi:uncharacterized protein